MKYFLTKFDLMKSVQRVFTLLCFFVFSAFYTANAQSVTIEKASASGCYYYNGASKTTISIQVGWTGANSGELITVTLDGSSTRTFSPQAYYDPGLTTNNSQKVAGPIVTPQVVAFEINSDGASHTIQAVLSNGSATLATSALVNVSAPQPCAPLVCSGTSLGGVAYYDNNANGIRDAGEIKMIAGVVVTAFDKLANKYTTTTDGNGLYSFTNIPTSNYPVRVEFTGWPVNVLSNSGPSSTTTNTSSVQFVTAPSCSINCGAVDPNYYTQANPTVFTNLYTNGDPLAGGDAASMPSIIAHAYDNTTDYTETTIATNAQTGSLWAHAWNKQNKVLFSAAFLKRHAGLGPLGLGGIYKVDYKNPTSPIVSSFLDVTTIGIDLGQSLVPSNSVRGLFAGKTTPNKDLGVFGLVGKVGIGGMTLSADGNTLYFVNLYDKKVYAIDITNYLITGTLPTSSNVTSYAVPDPSCTGGNYRPFAIKIYDGKLYVGVVCDALISQNKSDLTAHIYSLDLNNTSTGFTTVFDFPLTYPKGYPAQSHDTKTGWYPWTDDMSVTWGNDDNTYPQPVLSDIAFDLDGTMAIAFFDRTAHQVGTNNYDDPSFTKLNHESYAGGDILRAYFSNGAYILENAGKSGPYTGAQTNNNQGPGFGEFYSDNMYPTGGFHTEMVTGGLAIKPGSGEVLVGMVDPTSYKKGDIRQNGLRHLGNTTGLTNSAIAYYHTNNTVDEVASFGKGNGMGDIELATDVLSYLEIGNYVWNDANYNGIQDPTETGIAGIAMNLYNKNTGALVATEITDANGNYLFSTLKGDNILPNTDYVVVAGVGQYNATTKILTANGKDYAITPAFVGEGSNPTLNDNNFSTSIVTSALGAIPANLPKFEVTTGTVGYVNHTIDLGLTYGTIGNYVWRDTNKDGIQNEPAANGINGVTVNLLIDDGTGNFVVVATTTTADSVAGGRPGYYNFQIAQNGNYKVQFPVILNGSDSLTTQDATAATDFNSDADRTSGFSPAFTMDVTSTGITKNNPTIDAGYYTPVGSLGNYVWYDDNNDGINNEPATNGINGVTVELYKKNSSNAYVLFATTVTADSLAATGGTSNPGYYNFPNLLAGDYKVKFPTSIGAFPISDVNNQLPQADYNNDADKATGYSGVVTINPISTNGLDQNNPTIDAGYKTNIGSLGNYVWYDANGNGLQDEPAANGINGVKVYLYKSIAGVFTKVDSTITANNGSNPGYYNFPNLGSGNYQVEFPLVTSVGSLTIANQTAKTDGNSDADLTTGRSATVVINTQSADALDVNNPTIDAGYRPVGSLGNYVWYDSNNNGIKDEPATNGINGVTVKLLKDDGTGNFVLFATTTTADSLAATGGTSNPGYYNFPNLLSGKYIVQFPTTIGNYPISDVTNQAPQADYNNDADKETGYSGVVTIDVFGSGLDKDNPTIDAGYKTNIGSLGNYVWTDTNGDGIQNESSTNGINGVKVYLLQETTPGVYTKVDSTVTANNAGNPGYYNFPNLNSGNYKVQFPTTIYGSPLTKQTVTPQTDLNSDADSATGISPIVAINTSSSNPLDVNNPTIDAGYKYSVAPNCNMTASITVNQISQCVTNNQYQFTGNFTGGTGPYTFFWDLNDGTYAYTKDVTHTYAASGEHDVTLIVKDSRGCEAHASTVQIYIGAKPIAAFEVYGNSGTGSGVSFNSTSTISGGWMTYKWDLGNGTTSTLSNPGPIYYAPGTYTVTLIATGNFGCSDTVTKTIVVPNPGSYCTAPTAAFNINNATQCINGNAFAFTNATINGSTYKWTFGDGSATVTTSSANYTYASAGTYTVTLISTNTCGSDTITKTVVVKPLPATPAAISGVNTVKAGDVITLSTSSIGGVWSSSNPAVATVNAYGFVYGLTAGTTTISYTLNNDCGAVSATYVVSVIGSIVPPVVPPVVPVCTAPVANFTINTAMQCLAANSFTFTNTSTGTTPTYTWNFGDGSVTVSSTNAVHTYAAANTYNVTLTATNACGTNSVAKTITVTDVPAQPAAISGTTSVQVGSTTSLTSATTGGVWSSSNLGVATIDASGLVTGISAGSATVTYTVSNSCGNATRTTLVTITAPVSGGSGSGSSSGCVNPTASAQGFNVFVKNNATLTTNETEGGVAIGGDLTVNGNYQVAINSAAFTNTANPFKVQNVPIGLLVGGKVNYVNGMLQVNSNTYAKVGDATGSAVWYTDNQTIPNIQNIQITPGAYNANPRIQLNANQNTLGVNPTTNPVFQSGLIDFNTAFATMQATATGLAACASNASLTNPNGNVTGTTIQSVLTGGQLKINLNTGSNVLNVTGTDLNSVTNGITFNNKPDATHPLVINVNAPGSFTWNVWNQAGIGDNEGSYIIYNFYNTTSLNIAGNSTIQGTVFAPNADIIKTANQSNINGQVVGLSYTQSGGENHYHNFSPCITSCAPSVPPCTVPVANFTIDNASQCLSGNAFTFTNASSGTTPTYTWNFGDGSVTVSTTDATHNYTSASTYSVSLTATNSCGTNTVTKTITVNAAPAQPAAISGTPSIIVGGTTTLSSATVGGTWSSSNTNIATVNGSGVVTGVATGSATITYTLSNSCGNAATSLLVTVTANCAPTASSTTASICQGTVYNFNGNSYTSAGTYTVHLTNAGGCDSAASLVLTVNPSPIQPNAIGGNTTVLIGAISTLNTTPAGGVWTSSNTNVATINPSTGIVTGIAAGTTTITYTLSNGCGSKTVNTTVFVNAPVVVPPPTPTCNLAASFTINNNKQCVTDNSFVFTNTTTGGTAPFTYLWDLNDGSTATTKDVTKTYATFGEHDVTLKVADANGCVSNASAQQLYVGAKPHASFSILTNTGSGSSTTFISSSTIALGTMSYLWDLGNGQTSTSVNPTTNYTPAPATPYTVKLIVSGLGTCKDTAIQSYTQYAIASVSVYPNPVMDVIQVSFRAASSTPTTVKIMDLAGRVLQVQTVTPVSSGANVIATLDTRGLQSGSYIVYISDVQNGFIATKAILKQ
ncbi:SdrD B-like domain-containing protein [Parasediminibacterium paludis]|uniref:SdrD B-like domain-containing protein n=1 Tax=Parasediminibacterium paludis TaxID=908966 RepID=A0ABV8PUW6_9BACT